MRAALPAVLVIAGLGAGLAATLAVSPRSLGAAKVTVPRCTTGATSTISNLSGTSVVSVTVGNLPAACGGATIQAAVNNGSASSTGAATVLAAGGSVTITLAAAVAVATTMQTDVVMSGP
jgi:hypothetical protein